MSPEVLRFFEGLARRAVAIHVILRSHGGTSTIDELVTAADKTWGPQLAACIRREAATTGTA